MAQDATPHSPARAASGSRRCTPGGPPAGGARDDSPRRTRPTPTGGARRETSSRQRGAGTRCPRSAFGGWSACARLTGRGRWGATLGYAGLILDPRGPPIEVHVFESGALPHYWTVWRTWKVPAIAASPSTFRLPSVFCPRRSHPLRPRRRTSAARAPPARSRPGHRGRPAAGVHPAARCPGGAPQPR